ncbi:hypothetical protein BSL78_28597 [Apostichopus japonicus]|uniref:Uncharacterized protein n=1 Tax=Stichopus japonicus TaxID=307972 RepID=A0A2G8JFR6_STIJA|nr:hypothetical protein BSL78_28597 [Apostichopus japonicus]
MTSLRSENRAVRPKERVHVAKKENEDEADRFSLRRCRNMSPTYPPVSTNTNILPPYYTQTPDELFSSISEDLTTILDAADQSFTSAEQALKVFQTTFDQIDHDNPRCEEIGIYGVLKDLREETMKAVFDLERARLRAQKIQSEMTKLRRGLRTLECFAIRTKSWRQSSRNDQWRHLYSFYD